MIELKNNGTRAAVLCLMALLHNTSVCGEDYHWGIVLPDNPDAKFPSAGAACTAGAGAFPAGPMQNLSETQIHCSRILDTPPGFQQGFGTTYRSGDRCPDGMHYDDVLGECIDDDDDDCPRSGHPIEFLEGKKLATETDYAGAGGNLRFERHYSSYRTWSNVSEQWEVAGNWRFGALHYTLEILRTGDSNGPDIYVGLDFVRADNETIHFTGSHLTGGIETTTFPSNSSAKADAAPIVDASGNLSGWALKHWSGEIENYDTGGNLLSIDYRDGTQLLFRDIDAATREIEDSATGEILTITHTGGRVDSLEDPDGNLFSYGYNPGFGNRLETVTFPDTTADPSDNPVRTYHYENSNPSLVTGVTDERGIRLSTWGYDAQGRAILSKNEAPTETNGRDKTEVDYTYSTDPSDPRVIVTNALGQQSIYHFSEVNNMRKVVHLERVNWDHPDASQAGISCGDSAKLTKYDAATGFREVVVDWEGNVTQYQYDAAGNEETRWEGLAATIDDASLPHTITNTTETDDSRRIETQWHDAFRLPRRETLSRYDVGSGTYVAEKITDYDYECTNGRLQAQQVYAAGDEPVSAPYCPYP